MSSYLLSALALAGLGPFLGALPQEPGPAKQGELAKDTVAPDEAKTIWEYLSSRYDTNGDGKIARDEYSRGTTQFDRLDKDKNGFIEEADAKQQGRRGGGRGAGRRPAEAPTEGSVATDFQLETLYPVKIKTTPAKTPGTEPAPTYESVKLSSWKGKKPVALIFGSYT